jgi:hypothetical protein
MRSFATIATALALAMPGMIARAEEPRECAAVPSAPAADLAAYRKSAVWGPGLRAFEAGRTTRARRLLTAAWTTTRADLAQAFATDRCDEDRIARTLATRVFEAPPDALPSEDRFVPPRVVALALAFLHCTRGARTEAGHLLLDGTHPSDTPSRAAAAVLLAADGKRELAEALVPLGADAPWWQAAGAFIQAVGRDPGAADAALARLTVLAGRGAR